jgi:hypothetical protein
VPRRKGVRTGKYQGCAHRERTRIERALSAGASLRATARKFTISYHSLRRHWLGHVPREQRAAYIAGAGISRDQLEQVIADEDLSILDHLRIIRARLYVGFDAVSDADDRVTLDRLAGRLHENLALSAKLTGELQRGPLLNIQNNLMVNPDYSRAIARIVAAVAPYAEARTAVITALRELDAAATQTASLIIEAGAEPGAAE